MSVKTYFVRAYCVVSVAVFVTGAQQSGWFRQFGTSNDDQARAVLAVGPAVYVTGFTVGELRGQKKTGRTDSYLRRYDPDGNEVWTRQFGIGTYSEGSAIAASESEVRAAGVALEGVRKEAQGGQRTTVDVLNSQQDLISAKARLIGAQRDRVIASYTLLSAIGRLDVKTLVLNTPDYLPEVHYHQVRDAWHGLRTPSGQ